ncbi:MAG: hypothetical protein RQ753_06100 [Desulfurivibrionaceae bacterium]|nr:hypothetical protein [Desulfurivibrionaceae bacterium]
MTTEDDHHTQESCRIETAAPLDDEHFSLKNSDRFDKLVIVAVAVIIIVGSVLIVSHPGRDGRASGNGGVARPGVVIVSPELDNKLKVAETLLRGGNPGEARELIDSLIEDYPYDGRPYMLRGDLYVRAQQPVPAMLEYRRGVDLNPDFLDKKAELFRGKQVRNILEEARRAIVGGLEKTPGDPKLKEQRETYYYMLRRVAGSCG